MVMLLLVSFLLLLGIALMVLNSAIEHAEDGYEDETGFHQTERPWNPASAPEKALTAWDQREGASCPLDVNPGLRPAGRAPFNPQAH